MMSLKNKVLDTIEEREITPKPEWTFAAHSILLWTSVCLSVLLGALALSTIIFFSVNGDWDIIARLPHRVSFIVFTLPYAWLFVTVAALIFAEHQYRLTKMAYRHRYSMTVLGLFIATAILGASFYYAGIGQLLDARLEHVPGYDQLINPRAGMWNRAEEGRLAGVILEVINEEEVSLMDSHRSLWRVTFEEKTEFPEQPLREGKRVRLLGVTLAENEFRATRILPWVVREPDIIKIKHLRLFQGQ